jgi:CheY-like chemotaxis protein
MSLDPKRILIVDDRQSNRALLETLLRALGHVTDTAADGPQALAMLGLGFDLVLLDVTMPGMDGFEVTRRIRQNPAHSDLPILIVTALDGKESRLQAVEAGANDFIPQPVEYTELRVRTHSLLEMKAARDALKRHQAHLEEQVEQRTAALRLALDEVVATQKRLLEAEQEKKYFYGEVLRTVTEGKFHLVDDADLVADGQLAAEEPLETPEACRRLRLLLEAIAQNAGMDADRTSDLLLGVGEAAANAVKHAGQGHSAIYVSEEQVTVQVRDQGQGIRAAALPASVLLAGYSTKISLGMGFTLMLNVVDRLRLATSQEGTVVQLEKTILPMEDEEERLLALMERF